MADIFLSEKDGIPKRPYASTVTESHCESRLNSPTTYSFRNDIVDEDSVFIDHVTNNDDQDIMNISLWRRNVARFFVFTSLIPQLLAFWASRIQLQTLYHFGNDGSLPFGRFLLACGVVLWELVWASEHLHRIAVRVISDGLI